MRSTKPVPLLPPGERPTFAARDCQLHYAGHFEIHNSTISGQGVFALQKIPKGRKLLNCWGFLVNDAYRIEHKNQRNMYFLKIAEVYIFIHVPFCEAII